MTAPGVPNPVSSPGPPWTTSWAVFGWRWACRGRSGWRPTSAGADRAGWRAHRALLGLPRIAANQVPQP